MKCTIAKVYDQLMIPQNLRMHMLRVTAIAKLIAQNWTDSPLDQIRLTRVLLLHDIGNIVKRASASQGPATQKCMPSYWQSLIEKYGNDDHALSRAAAKTLGLSNGELDFMDSKIFINNDKTVKSSDYNLKVAAYADQRVAPTGVMSLMDRLQEAKVRYQSFPGSSMNNPKTDLLIQCAAQIEKQIMKHCKLRAEEITDEIIAPCTSNLLNFEYTLPD